MSNGLRQGSIMSPYLFNTYVDELNILLTNSKVGCHVGTESSNKISYADELAVIIQTLKTLIELLGIRGSFASQNYVEFGPTEMVVMLVSHVGSWFTNKPNVYMKNNFIS